MDPLLELIIELFCNLLFELVLNDWSGRRRREPSPRAIKVMFIAFFGSLMGWASVVLVRRPFITPIPFRFVYVVFAPLVIAQLTYAWNQARVRAGEPPGLLANWLSAWAFAFAFALVRLIGTLGYLKS